MDPRQRLIVRQATVLPDGASVTAAVGGRELVRQRVSGQQQKFPDHASYIRYMAGVNYVRSRRINNTAPPVPPPSVPGAPTINSITPSDSTLTVAFTAPVNNGGAPITSYKYSIDGVTYVDMMTTSSPITITGLTNGISYIVLIKAVNIAGDSEPSNALTGTPATTPEPPTGLSAVSGDTQVTISFISGSNNGSPITTYKYSTDGTSYTDAMTTNSPITITGLTNNTTYSITLKANNAFGDSSPSNAVSATPVPPTTPGAPTLTYVSPTNVGVYVYFTAGSGTITNYEYTLDSGATYTAFSPADIVSPVYISGLSNGTPISVQLRAVNFTVSSTWSNILTATPANQAIGPEWLFYDPNNNASYSGTGTAVNNLGTYGTLTGVKGANVLYQEDTLLGRKVFDFNGSGTYISYGTFDFGNTFTMSVWLNPREQFSSNGIIANVGPNVGTQGFKMGWSSWQTSDKRMLFEAGGTGGWSVPGTVANVVTVNEWQFLTYVFDKINQRILFYKNGTPVDTADIATAGGIITSAAFNIGAYIGGSYAMDARMGLIKVYNTALSASQVLNDFNNTKTQFGFSL